MLYAFRWLKLNPLYMAVVHKYSLFVLIISLQLEAGIQDILTYAASTPACFFLVNEPIHCFLVYFKLKCDALHLHDDGKNN